MIMEPFDEKRELQAWLDQIRVDIELEKWFNGIKADLESGQGLWKNFYEIPIFFFRCFFRNKRRPLSIYTNASLS